jgi:acetolactate decarboxylase
MRASVILRPGTALLLTAATVFSQARTDTLFQTSTIDALLQGVYEGEMTFAELRRHGDFGIGTLNAADGEVIALDGHFFQVASDGKARPVPPTARTPFATVTRFEADITLAIGEPISLEALEKRIDADIPGTNYFYAIRITGRFDWVKTRSVPRQNPPYVPLTEVVKAQPVFEFANVDGVLAGFRCPEFAKSLNVTGYHLHFLNRAKTAGGHVLGLMLHEGKVEIDIKRGFEVSLPTTAGFREADLIRDRTADLQRVEK